MDPEKVQKLSDDDIIGHQHVVKQLRRTIGISLRGAGRGSVLSQGRGFLLSGPPGTGKTTIAELAAQQNNCNLLRISPDLLRDKLYGETEKTVAAIFSLSRKLWETSKKPTIVFMDEVDTILGDTTDAAGSEHEANRTARSLFAQKWDGIEAHPGLIIFGTTNHENKLPHYIYRRFTSRSLVAAHLHSHMLSIRWSWVALPNREHRRLIFKRFITTAATELAALWGDGDGDGDAGGYPADGPPADPDGVRDEANPDDLEGPVALGRYVDLALLDNDPRGARPLSTAQLQCFSAALRPVLHPSVPVQEILSHPFLPPLERLARLTHGYAGSDIRDVVHHGTPQDEHVERITYETLLQGLVKVIATENRSKQPGHGRGVMSAAQHNGALPVVREASGPAAVPTVGGISASAHLDSALLQMMMYYHPLIKIVILSVMVSLTAKISSNMNAIRMSMQSKESPQ